MGSKNNPRNRVRGQKKEYEGQEVVPAMFMDAAAASAEKQGGEKAARRMMVAQFVKTRKLVTDSNGNLVQWNAV